MKAYKFKINGKEYNVAVNGIEGKNADVTVNGVNYQVELENEVSPAASAQAPASVSGPQAIPLEGAQGVKTPTANNAVGGKKIGSPLPGVIISVDVKEGQAVKRGQKVAVIEAMKMENEILAECDGTITAIHVKQGDSVLEGADIVTIG
ncbi:MAG: biotin/lipoyl-containing protein [Bacteroidales bacterium]|nr:biotin/lipoyl-containing protein [Bacteroidales bacterium]MDY6443401.1 biotin/lipoyl-containing protein [Bacteroidales bacterium]